MFPPGAAWQTHAEEQVIDEDIKALHHKKKRKLNSNWEKKIQSSTTFGSNYCIKAQTKS